MTKVLVFEDDIALLELYINSYKQRGVAGVCFSSSPKDQPMLVRLVQEERPDVITSDIRHPGMDGLTMLRMLTSDARTREIPVAIITNRTDRRDEALRGGAAAFIVTGEMTPTSVVETVVSLAKTRTHHEAVQRVKKIRVLLLAKLLSMTQRKEARHAYERGVRF